MWLWTIFLILLWECNPINAATACNKRFYDQDSFVCVCDKNSCDDIAPVGDLSGENVYVYSTSLKNDRLTQSRTIFQDKLGRNIRATIDTTKKYQKILGFGGAVTDSVITLRNQLKAFNASMAELLHQNYYGIDYRIGRVPLASCDYSDRAYSFLDTPNDFELKTFNLNDIKIEYLQKIVKEVPDISLYASPWSAPGWMKQSGKMAGPGIMQGTFNGIFYLAYARYIIRFFEEYYKLGVKFWGLTVQNEPDTGALIAYPFQTMYMSSAMQRDFVNLRLGPMMKNNWMTKDIKIIGADSWRNVTMDAAETIYRIYNIYNDPSAVPGDYTSGLATHWYVMKTPFAVLSNVHKLRPDKFILASEACNSFEQTDQIPYYGRWLSAELYAHDIIQNLKNWVIGWTDWNLWLDTWGGPNWVGNFVDAPILINITEKNAEFYKQTSYYAMGHFSKFIPPNSFIVDLDIEGFDRTSEDDLLEGIAALTPQGNVVLVLQNREDSYTYDLEIDDLSHGGDIIRLSIGPKTIKTLVWKLTP